MSDHEYFTVDETALTIPKRGAVAIYCSDAPRRDEAQSVTHHSMCAPMLIIPPDMFKDPKAIATSVASILNARADEFYPSAKKDRPTADACAALVARLRAEVTVGSGTVTPIRLQAASAIEDLAAQAPVLETAAARDVLAERARQISMEGWTPEHDDGHDKGEMALAAIAYLMAAVNPNAVKSWWPWEWKWFKPGPIRRMLVKAAALILAEIERLDRASAKEAAHG